MKQTFTDETLKSLTKECLIAQMRSLGLEVEELTAQLQTQYYKQMLETHNTYRWHDLRKNPEDLPENFHNVFACIKGFEDSVSGIVVAMHSSSKKRWATTDTCYNDEQIVGWREIEPFEDY